MIDREKVARVFPEKIKVGDEEQPDLAAMALNLAIARITSKQKAGRSMMSHTPDIQSQGGEDRQYFVKRECIQCHHLIGYDDLIQTAEGDLHEHCIADYGAEHDVKLERDE